MMRFSLISIACVYFFFNVTVQAMVPSPESNIKYVPSLQVQKFVAHNSKYGVTYAPAEDRILCPTCLAQGTGMHEWVRSQTIQELYGSWCVMCDAQEWELRVRGWLKKLEAKKIEKAKKKDDLRIGILRKRYEKLVVSRIHQTPQECSKQ